MRQHTRQLSVLSRRSADMYSCPACDGMSGACCLMLKLCAMAYATFFLPCALFTCEYAKTPASAMPVPAEDTEHSQWRCLSQAFAEICSLEGVSIFAQHLHERLASSCSLTGLRDRTNHVLLAHGVLEEDD